MKEQIDNMNINYDNYIVEKLPKKTSLPSRRMIN